MLGACPSLAGLLGANLRPSLGPVTVLACCGGWKLCLKVPWQSGEGGRCSSKIF